jgi:glucose/arabinose dehydrogenase
MTLLLLICLVGGAIVYGLLRQRVNVRPLLGQGDVADITVPPGFAINVFAEGLNGPRFIAFGPDGTLYVADRGNDRIVTLPDQDGDGTADSIQVFADNLNQPHSLVFHQGAWYVGVPSGVVRLQDTDGDGTADARTTVIDDYPTSGVHSTRTVEFLPDGRMVVSIGSSCNVCAEEDPRRAAVVVYDSPVGQSQATGEQLFATGLRNAVGLAVHPETGELWATNNGRDLMGDDTPPETVYILQQGADYGWPTCHSGDIIDPDMGEAGDCQGVTEPVAEMQAHMAPLGLVFYTGDSFPQEHHGDLFIAFHGSWNRSVPVGYKVGRLPLDDGQPAGPLEDFATGWLRDDGTASGRPVGLAVGPEGALYVSDDKGDFIYRIYSTGE